MHPYNVTTILQLSNRSILLAIIFILLFSRAVAIAVSPGFFFAAWRSSLLSTIFNSSCQFYCRAIFIAAVHFVAVQPDSNCHVLFGRRFCSGSVVGIFIKHPLVVITGHCPIFFCLLLVVWLCSYSALLGLLKLRVRYGSSMPQ